MSDLKFDKDLLGLNWGDVNAPSTPSSAGWHYWPERYSTKEAQMHRRQIEQWLFDQVVYEINLEDPRTWAPLTVEPPTQRYHIGLEFDGPIAAFANLLTSCRHETSNPLRWAQGMQILVRPFDINVTSRGLHYANMGNEGYLTSEMIARGGRHSAKLPIPEGVGDLEARALRHGSGFEARVMWQYQIDRDLWVFRMDVAFA